MKFGIINGSRLGSHKITMSAKSSMNLILAIFTVFLSSLITWSAIGAANFYVEAIAEFGSSQSSREDDTSLALSTTSRAENTLTTESNRVCRGTSKNLGHSPGHYREYVMRYANCTYVDGNLEIVFIDDANFDLSFLSSIREVTGYVLIVANYVSYVPLTSLRVIRGRTLYEHDGRYYSLYVTLNYDKGRPGVGLKELRFVSLHEIAAGSVFLFDNLELCYDNTIAWNDTLTGEGAKVVRLPDSAPKRATCGPCHDSCTVQGQQLCWGSGAEHCQKLTKLSCSPQCDGRCFGPLPNQCCHSECAGGCTGPSKTQCWACKNFDNEHSCENFCPPEFIYSPVAFKQVPNPRAKFAYGSLCVNECPSHLMADKGACVQDCGAGRVSNKNRICSDCVGPCPKTCSFPYDIINSHNVNNLTGCTIVQGRIKILDISFDGDKFFDVPPMPVSALSALENIQEVTDYVQIQANHMRFRSLSFLKNLRIVHGRNLGSSRTAIEIYQTSLESLELVSLQGVRYGHIFISNNSRLCYASRIRWESFRADAAQKVIVQHNRNSTSCELDNEVCSSECSSDGCWGPGDDQCVSCRNFRLDKRCISRCDSVIGVYTSGPSECKFCNPECKNSCSGNGSNQCDECRNARDGPYCVAKCPDSKYRDENGICQPCHENCAAGKGCTGPRNTVGEGGCQSCSLVLLNDESIITQCLPPDTPCEDGYYRHNYPNLPGSQACYRCHPECRTCYGNGLSFCSSCMHYTEEDRCVRECSSDYYVNSNGNGEADKCYKCDPHCMRCTGPTLYDCISCKQYKVYFDGKSGETNQRFNCTETCPDYAPFKLTKTEDGNTETVCVSEDGFEKTKQAVVFSAVIGCLVLLSFVVIAVAFFLKQRKRAVHDKKKLTQQLTGHDETLPLSQTDARPDMSKLVLIKESDLRQGKVLGSGAFGTVYSGCWIQSEDRKVPVAIKVLSEGTSPGQNKELLEEARIMASVIHPCCVQIQAVCMTAKVMLVSELMPMGCLLDYVRKDGKKLDSKTLLLWSKQIAQGMNHLERKGIVHRDLAARNVLVQNLQQVKITDFGLAKLLDYKEDQFQASGGKMPIKWLALECILYRRFTHKSDVWSFGVTLWELYTFGSRPYHDLRAADMVDYLEKGGRLKQPDICTLDIWMLLLKCWCVDVEDRPSFSCLADEFDKMLRNPTRYLCVSSDSIMNQSSENEWHGNGGRLSPTSDPYLQPKSNDSKTAQVTNECPENAFGCDAGAATYLSQHRPQAVVQRQRNGSGGHHLAGANPARSSLRYCSEPSVHAAAAANAVHYSSANATAHVVDSDYMQPSIIADKYFDVADGRRGVGEKIDEEADCEDDGFDSETMTPTGGHDYYNSMEQLNLETMPLKDLPSGKRPPVRGNSESIGSLDTDITESVIDEAGDHDYYNELPPIRVHSISLNPKVGGILPRCPAGTDCV